MKPLETPQIQHLADLTSGPSLNSFTIKELLTSNLRAELYTTESLDVLNRKGKKIEAVSSVAASWQQAAHAPVLIVRDLHSCSEKWEQLLRQVAREIAPPLSWMYRNAAASFSTHAATLGYHADNYHVAILQLEGERHWQVWNQDVLSSQEQRFLQRERPHDTDPLPRLPSQPPILDTLLKPGQLLWIPALHPHLGSTSSTENATSISFIWQPPSFLKLAYQIRPFSNTPISTQEMEILIPALYSHLPWYNSQQAKGGLLEHIFRVGKLLGLTLSEAQADQVLQLFFNDKTME